MPLKSGQALSHYKILEKIGAGGMGEVYRAYDTRLEREVAVKVLPEAFAADPERLARFEREAKSIAALSHPNIVVIHSVEESDGLHFLTMELVEGKTLTHSIRKNGLPLDQIFKIASQVLDAVNTAHRQGIMHRDLKPGNIMVTSEGRVKVLDFGLAKLMEEPAAPAMSLQMTEPVTAEGHIVGTVAYMSPEQAEGKPVDPRSDIFSLGIILYEMATGKRPFQGDTSASLISSILRDMPPPVTELNDNLPRHFGRIVKRCLSKNPKDRYQTAADVRIELKGLKSEHDSEGLLARPDPRSGSQRRHASRPRFVRGGFLFLVAVLLAAGGYFAVKRFAPPGEGIPVSAGDEDEAFVVAIAPFWGANTEAMEEGKVMQTLVEREVFEELGREENVTILGKEISEIPRSHAAAHSLGERLGATAVIWGEVLVLRGEVDIQPYITMTKPVSSREDESPDALEIRLDEPDQLSVRKAKAEEMGDLALLVAGSFYREKDPEKALVLLRRIAPPSRESVRAQGRILEDLKKWEKAERHYRRSIELDPEWAKPHDNLAHLLHYQLDDSDGAIREYERAIEIDPEWTKPHSGLGRLLRERGDYARATKEFERAMDLDSKDSWPHHELGHVYEEQKMYSDAEREYEKAIELNPDRAWNYVCFAKSYKLQLRYEEALAKFEEAAQVDTTLASPHNEMGLIYYGQERYEAALAEFERALELKPDWTSPLNNLGLVYQLQGRIEEAIATIQKAIEIDPEDADYHFALGLFYVDMGRFEDSDLELERALELNPDDKFSHLHYFIGRYRAGNAGAAHARIGEFAKRLEGDEWIIPVIRFYAGEVGEETVWEAANDTLPEGKVQKQCEAYYYLGIAHLLGMNRTPADTAKAKEYFEKCVATEITGYIEYTSAKAELERINRN